MQDTQKPRRTPVKALDAGQLFWAKMIVAAVDRIKPETMTSGQLSTIAMTILAVIGAEDFLEQAALDAVTSIDARDQRSRLRVVSEHESTAR